MTSKEIIIIREKIREASDAELYQLFASLANSYSVNIPSFIASMTARLGAYERKIRDSKRKEEERIARIKNTCQHKTISNDVFYTRREKEKAKEFLKRFDKNSIVYVDRDAAGYIVIEEFSLNPRYLRSSQNFREDYFPSVKKRTLLTDIVNC